MHRTTRKIFLFIFFFALFTGSSVLAQSKKGFVINGQLEGLKDGDKVCLQLRPDFRPISTLDSTVVKNGKFELHGYLTEGPMMGSLTFYTANHKFLRFLLLDNTNINVRGKIVENLPLNQTISIFGNQLMINNQAMGTAVDVLVNIRHGLYGIESSGYFDKLRDSIGYDQKIMDGVMATKEIFLNSLKAVFEQNYNGAQASMPFVFDLYYGYIGHEPFWPKFYDKFPVEVKNTYYGGLMQKRLKYCIGNPAPDFSSTTPEGKTLSLKEVIAKGKITIIDFWASWCAICRVESREMIPMYQKYHDKGLNIIGVSNDDDDAAWKKAIAKDHYDWYQVSSLKGKDDPVFKLYEAENPTNVLVDGEGKIIAWNLDPLEMEWYVRKYTGQ